MNQVVMLEALSDSLTITDMMSFYNVSNFPFNFNLVVNLHAPLTGKKIKEQEESP